MVLDIIKPATAKIKNARYFFRGTLRSAIATRIGVTTQPLPSQETAEKKLSQNAE
jgi:hypothetical protein